MVTVTVLVAAADQVSKSIVLATRAGTADGPVGGWVSIQLARNHGASTGIGAGHPLLVTVVESAATLFVAGLAVGARRTGNRVVAIALALVLGGAIGNLADRFVRSPGWGRGAVVDWIHFGGRGGSLDLADLAVQFGAVIALVATLASIRSDSRRRRFRSATGRLPAEGRPELGGDVGEDL